MKTTFAMLRRCCKAAGLVARECTPYHWQVTGGPNVVNFYPTRETVHVNGTAGAQSHRDFGIWTPEQLVELALGPPPMKHEQPKRMPQPKAKRIRLRLLRKNPRCHWCFAPLDVNTSTLDHRIPLARGGSNLLDNLVLACRPCNQRRGHDMPELAPVGRTTREGRQP